MGYHTHDRLICEIRGLPYRMERSLSINHFANPPSQVYVNIRNIRRMVCRYMPFSDMELHRQEGTI